MAEYLAMSWTAEELLRLQSVLGHFGFATCWTGEGQGTRSENVVVARSCS